MNDDYQIEINLQDVVTKLTLELNAAQRDAAVRYAMVEALKRRIAELEKNEADAPAPAR